MAWEKRRNGTYYYRKVWSGGTCRSEYIGGGLIGQVAANRDRRFQEARNLQARDEEVATVATNAAVMRQIDELGDQVGALLGIHLLLAGYHQHKRQWRKQRDQTSPD